MDSWRGVSVPELPGRGPEPRIRDTATGELAVAAQGHVATMYVCGITPYDATHIGHAYTYNAWDLLVRAWLDAGHEVRYVQNVTDVDDPLLERATRDGVDWRELADREIDRYRRDMEALRMLPPDHLIGAVEAIPQIERFTTRLADRGALYDVDSDVYFARSSDPAFGSVSGLDTEAMIELSAQRGGDPGRAGKKDPLDALVWLAARPGEPSWASASGSGRPGWHVECAAIATDYLGPVFDLQAGGSDLIFPHHEMSASHARVAQGVSEPAFARHYAHSGMVGLGGEKMSKSLGNLVFVSELLSSGTDPGAIRLALQAHHYRDDWEWTDGSLRAAQARLELWRTAVSSASGPGSPAEATETVATMRERLADDLDARGALDAMDRWAGQALSSLGANGADLIRAATDALLGIKL
ncbi:MAG TPA: cysteine--1-D-myo-inosityl 2-amino-2-deoxy-alpha-D-glucopyranoside ligase [Streptosporangiaceae bacterium]|jgi:L-cysteine:1D-myo-inositol 2-amino-2-deoxy-alpha-D-glucopyranoside ligase